MFDPAAEGCDSLLYNGAPSLLFLHRGAFKFGGALLSDIVVGGDPAAVRHGAVDDRQELSVRRFEFVGGGFAACHRVNQVAAVDRRIFLKGAVGGMRFEHLGDGGAGFGDPVGQMMDFFVALVEQH